jgi:hypothetical protein
VRVFRVNQKLDKQYRTSPRRAVFLSMQSEVRDMNTNTGVYSDDLAQSLSDRFNATAASFDRAALQISRTLRQSKASVIGKPSTGR